MDLVVPQYSVVSLLILFLLSVSFTIMLWYFTGRHRQVIKGQGDDELRDTSRDDSAQSGEGSFKMYELRELNEGIRFRTNVVTDLNAECTQHGSISMMDDGMKPAVPSPMTEGDKARDAVQSITKSIARLNEAISLAEGIHHIIVLACEQQGLITPQFSKELLNPWKSTQARATDLINCIQTVVGYRPECLDEFLSILVVKGGILGLEVAGSVAKDYPHYLPKYREAYEAMSRVPKKIRSLAVTEEVHHISIPSVTDFCNTYGIDMDCLQMTFTDDLLVLLALEGQKVEDVAGYFDMEDYINQIDESQSANGKIMSILSKWKETKGDNVSYLAVIETLLQHRCLNIAKLIARSIKKKYCNTYGCSVLFKPEKSFSNWNDFDDDHKVRIRNSLREENDKIMDLFGETFLDILHSIKEQETDIRLLQLCLEVKLKNISSSSLNGLKQTKDVIDIFKFIRSIGCNWFNYHLLDVLTYHYGGDEDKQMMSDYVKRLWAYLQRSLYRIPPESFGPSQITDAYHFILPIADGNDMSGQQLKHIQLMLAEKLEIPPHMQIEIRPGSIMIHFIVSEELFNNSNHNRLDGFTKDADNDRMYYINVEWLRVVDEVTSHTILSMCGYIDDPVSCILQLYSGRLSQIALPLEVVQLLYTEGIIDRETCDGVMSSGGRLSNESFRALHSAVYLDNNKLEVFASVLLKFKDTVPIAKDILQSKASSSLTSNKKYLFSKLFYSDKKHGSYNVLFIVFSLSLFVSLLIYSLL